MVALEGTVAVAPAPLLELVAGAEPPPELGVDPVLLLTPLPAPDPLTDAGVGGFRWLLAAPPPGVAGAVPLVVGTVSAGGPEPTPAAGVVPPQPAIPSAQTLVAATGRSARMRGLSKRLRTLPRR